MEERKDTVDMSPITEETFAQDEDSSVTSDFATHYKNFLDSHVGEGIFKAIIEKVVNENPSFSHGDISQILVADCAKMKMGLSDEDLLRIANTGSACGVIITRYLPPEVAKLCDKLPSEELSADDFATFGDLTAIFVWEIVDKLRSRRSEDISNIFERLKENFSSIDIDGLAYPLSMDSSPNDTVRDFAVDESESNANKTSVAYMLYESVKGNITLSPVEIKEEEKVEEPIVEDEERIELPADIQKTVDDTVESIMNIYENLYGLNYTSIPMGILTSAGILFNPTNPQLDISTRLYAAAYFNAVDVGLKLGVGGYEDKVLPDNAYDFLENTYYPTYHLLNVFGYVDSSGKKYKSWSEAKAIIKKRLEKYLPKLFLSYKGDEYIEFSTEVRTRLTDCIIVNEFNTKGMMEFTYHMEAAGGRSIFGDLVVPNMSKIIGVSTGVKIAEPALGYNVFKFLYVTDGDAYNKEILFAYKIYEKYIESGTPINSQKIVLGKNLKNGLPLTENFLSEQQIFATILASSGSGKGVLTLSILAGLLAAGHPVAYLDHKPDMASMLWDMERKLVKAGSNVRIMAIDSLENKDGDTGSTPVREYTFGLHGGPLLENDAIRKSLSIIPYLKMMQLSCVIAQLRSSGNKIGIKDDTKLFFILDEAEKVNDVYNSLNIELAKHKMPKPKKGEDLVLSPFDKAVERYKVIFQDDLVRGIRGVGNTTGRKGNIGYILVGQNAAPASWKNDVGGGDWKYSLFGYPNGKTSLKLMGKGIERNSMYAIPKEKFDGDNFFGNMGYWAVSHSAASGNDKDIKVMKSYLVLNENDYGTPTPKNAMKLLKNVTDEKTYNHIVNNEFTMGDGVTVRESIGFYGLMKLLVNNDEQKLAETMGSMYEIVERVLVKAGVLSALGYKDVEEYLFSCDYLSFFSIYELVEAYKNGGIQLKEDFGGDDELSQLKEAQKRELEGIEAERDDYTPEEFKAYKDDVLARHQKELEEAEERKERRKSGAGGFGFGYGDMTGDGSTTGGTTTGGTTTGGTTTGGTTTSGTTTGGTTTGGTTTGGTTGATTEPIRNPAGTSAPNVDSAYTRENSVHIPMPTDPFNTLGKSGSPMSCINAFKSASATILNAIKEQFGSLSRIYSVHIANDGLVVINEVKFMPTFDIDFIQSLPVDMQGEVSDGKIAQLFYFGDIYKFSNMSTFIVDNTRLAEQRIRTEMGVRGNWDYLFNKFNNLQTLIIGGVNMGEEGMAQEYEDDDRGGFGLRDKLANFFGLDDSNSWTGRLWKSKPVRTVGKIFGGALGATVGVKLLMGACTIFGPWGLLFSAFAVGGAVHEYKKNNPRGGHSNNNGSGTTTRTTSNKNKNK